jgi:hypothetical protein
MFPSKGQNPGFGAASEYAEASYRRAGIVSLDSGVETFQISPNARRELRGALF